MGLKGPKKHRGGGGWGEPFLLRLPEAQGPLAACSRGGHSGIPTCLSGARAGARTRQTLTNSKMKSRSGKVVKTAKPLGRLLAPDAAGGHAGGLATASEPDGTERCSDSALAALLLRGAQWPGRPARGLRARGALAEEGGVPAAAARSPPETVGARPKGPAQRHGHSPETLQG